MKKEITNFLEKYNSLSTQINKEKFIDNFIREMELGLNKSSSLPMIPSFVFSNLKLKNYNKHLLIDAGGTNLRIAIGQIKNNKIKIENEKKFPMPGKEKQLTRKEFYSSIAENTKYIDEKYDNLGYCFSFAVDVDESLDGKIESIGKKLKLDDVVGTKPGLETTKALKNISGKHNAYIINDTIATLLGSKLENKKEGNYIGYILGTGCNSCYYEKVKNIKKIKCKNKSDMIINIESSYFKNFEHSVFEKMNFKNIQNEVKLEKSTSGLYFSNIINNALNYAHKEKLINHKKEFSYRLHEYSDFIKNKNDLISKTFKNKKDIKIAKEIIKELTKRNAILNSLVLTSLIKKSSNNKLTNFLSIEGSTYQKFPNLKKYIIRYTKKLNADKKIKFLSSSNLNLKGALYIASAK